MNLRHLVRFVLGLFLLLAACSPTKPDNLGVTNDGTTVNGTGTIRYDTLEGGFWVIVGDDHVHYEPINLDQSCRIGCVALRGETAQRQGERPYGGSYRGDRLNPRL
jgi:hypothetical protein